MTITLDALADISVHLIEKHGFRYVMLGKLQSDPLEGRFGIYRQVNGASYFFTVRQALQAEKKLRVLNILQKRRLEDAATDGMSELKELSQSVVSSDDADVKWLSDYLQFPDEPMSDADDKTMVYYISGFVGRSISRSRKCVKCKTLLVIESESFNPEDLDKTDGKLFEILSRGGLARPSPLNLEMCNTVFGFFSQISDNPLLQQEFLKKQQHLNLFVESVFLCTNAVCPWLTEVKCDDCHLCYKLLCAKLFNLFSRNVLKRINDSFTSTSVPERKLGKFENKFRK